MNTVDERTAVKNAYPWGPWKKRVDKMTDAQIHAIYLRLKQQNKL